MKENQRENQHDDISAEEIEKRTSFKALDTDKDKVGRIIGINLPASPEQSKELIPQKKPKGKKNIHEQIEKLKARSGSAHPNKQPIKSNNKGIGD